MKVLATIFKILLLSPFFNQPAQSMINLFISKAEMIRTLGLWVELNYIENGVINSYSVKFPFRIKTNVSYVLYSWNTKVVDQQIYYMIQAISHDSTVLPLIHIPSRGALPLNTETFKIEYRCAGIKAGKFDIRIDFNFTWPSVFNQTNVSLKQEKLCISRDVRRVYGGKLTETEVNRFAMPVKSDCDLITARSA